MQCAKEREVKKSVGIELVKALRQARFILTGEIQLEVALSQQLQQNLDYIC
jgi:hypothetical protein